MTDIFREIDEELKQDQLKKLWKRYGSYVIAVVVLLVVGVGGYQAWRAWDLDQRLQRSEDYAAALDKLRSGDDGAARAALAPLAAPDGSGYGLLAAFEEASLKAEAGDRDGAIELWDKIAANSSAGPAFRGVATLLSTMHQLEDGDPAVLEARLEPLSGQDSAFRASALEMLAVLALRRGDQARAREFYAGVADDRTAPPAARTRATQMLEALDG